MDYPGGERRNQSEFLDAQDCVNSSTENQPPADAVQSQVQVVTDISPEDVV
jgi:hypothetical protein